MAALSDGSRRLPGTATGYGSSNWTHRKPKQKRWVKVLRWVIRGSRLLPSDRTTTLRSGSPPGAAAIIDRLPELQRKLLTTTQTQHRRCGIIRDRDLQEVQAPPDHKRFAGDDRLFRIKAFLAMNQGISDANCE